MDVDDRSDPQLRDEDQAAIFAHARTWFPELVAGDGAFADLPLLDRTAAEQWYTREVRGTRTFTSSGTSGHPKRIPWTAAEDDWYVGEKQHLFADWLAGCRRGFISLAVGHNAGSAHRVLEHLGMAVHDAGLSDLGDQHEMVVAFRPDVLYCSPTILDRLVTTLADARDRPPVRRVITNGEVLYPALRRRVQRCFGLPEEAIIDTYGSTEIGTIAASCPSCSRYHLLDQLYPEGVDPAELPDDLRPPGPGRVALAVSSLKRTAFPILRFLTYDVIEGLSRTRCGGAERFTFDRIVGRCDDVVNYGELFSTYELADLIRGSLPGAGWFVFSARNDLTVVIEGAEPAGFRDELAKRYPLHSRMVQLGLLPPPDLRFVERFADFSARAGLPAGPGGKDVRRIVPTGFDERWLVDLAAAH
jgi:phenylacetate-coenzyme A ligase PaaK-like adenylate-forming protein